ncbi:MAG: hypothetical protein HC910_19135 [Spirulinaceae cyanobacterium SM2_1_0]|nr:hypothetical protein [Spirulinaceae cyanobacterium SM2_1_0]
MSQTTTIPTAGEAAIADLKKQVRRLNSKAGQIKMDLHDLAEGLPNDYEQLPALSAKTYDIFCQLQALRQQLKELEANA